VPVFFTVRELFLERPGRFIIDPFRKGGAPVNSFVRPLFF
jgi:hypothetical protein